MSLKNCCTSGVGVFLPIGLAFLAIGLSGQIAFVGLGAGFVAIALARYAIECRTCRR